MNTAIVWSSIGDKMKRLRDGGGPSLFRHDKPVNTLTFAHTGGPKCQPSAGSYTLQNHYGLCQGGGWVCVCVGPSSGRASPHSISWATLRGWQCQQGPGSGNLLSSRKTQEDS